MAEQDTDYVEMGRISGLYGVRGWVKVFSHAQPRENILSYSPWYLEIDGRWVPFEVKEGRRQGSTVVAHLEGCSDRDAAARLLQHRIAVHRDQLPPAGEDECYWADLIGLSVVTIDGTSLGTVANLMETGANDVLVVSGDRERLIPFTPGDAVRNVDLNAGVITVDWDPEF